MRHQRMALAWMFKRELESAPPGGILADDQGLGKTVSTISLIVTNTPDPVTRGQRKVGARSRLSPGPYLANLTASDTATASRARGCSVQTSKARSYTRVYAGAWSCGGRSVRREP